MKTCLKSFAGCILFAAAAAAQVPSIVGVANNYSGVAPGLPNYGIAQGSIFLIIGSNLAASNTGLQNPPLPTALNGVTVKVTPATGAVQQCILYYVTTGQIAAILPSATPVGNGTITVTTAAGTSAPAPIVVVQSAFGILTANGAGTGMGQIQDANNNYNLLSLTSSAKPGDYIVLWGSGLGPVSGSETVGAQQDFGTNLPIEVDVGGVSAQVFFHGRSAYPGLDEVIVIVPPGISGCSASIVVLSKNNKIVSNVVTAPIAASGGVCSDASTGYTSAVLQKCASSGCSRGSITVSKTATTTVGIPVPGLGTVGGGTTTTDDISASFSKVTAAQAALGVYNIQTVSVGSCSVYTASFSSSTTTPTIPIPAYTALNAGTITANTPNTTKTMTFQNGGYDVNGSGGTLIPASGGNFSFNNGGGGPDIGAFTTQISLGAPLTSNLASLTTVNRSSGATVTWTGGTTGTYVVISGSSIGTVGTSGSSFVAGLFWCTAPQSQGSFAIPATVLLALPATGSITQTIPVTGTLAVSNSTNPVNFTANNLDAGILTGEYTTSQQVTYQ